MLKSGLLIGVLLASSSVAHAQSTSAGGQLKQLPPAPAIPRSTPDFKIEPPSVAPDTSPAGATIRVSAVRVTGATLFDEPTLLAAGGFTPDSALNLADLRTIAARISAYYHARGYFLAQAYLPEQDVNAGSVTIAVIEGRYGAVSVNNTTNLSTGVARGVLSGLNDGDIVAGALLERRLLLLSDLPGVRVKSTLAPGTTVGTSDLIVDLSPGRRVTGSVEADNAGNRFTGTYRLGGTVNLNNAAGIGDQLSLRALASSGGLAYGRAAYQAPIGNLTLGAAYARIRYQLGREFDRLDADGTADIATLYASYPLVRSRDANLYALGALEAKWFEDKIGLVSSQSNRRSRIATLGFSGDTQDGIGGGGSNNFSGRVTFGELDIESPIERAADAVTARRDGGFTKIEMGLARSQTISGPLSLFASVRGQYAFDNLDTSEQMELGGAYAVRAYPEGESFGDQGYVATAEARLTVSQWFGGFPGALQAIAFVDVGSVEFAHDPWFAGRNRATLSGIGGGLTWAGPDNFLVRASYAAKLSDEPATSEPDRPGRFWFQIVTLF